ncbi:ADP-ribosylglycohydrolase family protein [Yinghuangia aomiensis]
MAAASPTTGRDAPAPARELLTAVADRTPYSEVRGGLAQAADLPEGSSVRLAVTALGSGQRISCPDTVPFALWTAAWHQDDLVDALWATASGQGDIDDLRDHRRCRGVPHRARRDPGRLARGDRSAARLGRHRQPLARHARP